MKKPVKTDINAHDSSVVAKARLTERRLSTKTRYAARYTQIHSMKSENLIDQYSPRNVVRPDTARTIDNPQNICSFGFIALVKTN
jgi:hypothetical protein